VSKIAFLLLTAAVLCSPRVYAGGCDGGSRGSSFLQGRCVYDLIRRNKCPKHDCCHAVEVKPAPHPVCSDCKPACCKSSRWSRMFSKKCDSCAPKKCDCYTPKKCDCYVPKKCDSCAPKKKCDSCGKRGWFGRMGDWLMEEPGCGRQKKTCCGDATFYTPSVVIEPAKTGPAKGGPEVLPKPPAEVTPKKN